MHFNSLKFTQIIFKVLCLIATVSMIVYCSYEFFQNKDLSEVSFVDFNSEDENSMYPQISLCFNEPFLENELKKLGDGVNSTTYSQFLSGETWDERMRDIDIEKVSTRLEDNLVESCVRSSFDGNCEEKGYISSRIVHYRGSKCLSFHFTYPKTVWDATMWIKSSIFSNGIRLSEKFVANIGFPQQVLRMSSAIVQWKARGNSSNNYSMLFYVGRIEVIRRRQKPGNRCRDWKNFDSIVEEDILSEVGCRPVNLASLKHFPPCSTKEQMKRIHERYLSNLLQKDVPPCSEIENMQISVHEEDANFTSEKQMYPDLQTDLGKIDGWFRVSVVFRATTFKEIKQIRAYSVQSLIGNAGGYVGLFVGYTIAELPILLSIAYKWMISVMRGQNVPNGDQLSFKVEPSLYVREQQMRIKLERLEDTVKQQKHILEHVTNQLRIMPKQ